MSRYVVTGANRGLGLELVRQLLARGERVIAGCRRPGQAQALNQLAGAYPGHLHVLPLDAASERSIVEFAREAALVAERVDVLINNAGVLIAGERFGTVQATALAESFAVNASAPLLLVQALAPLLRAAAPGARVINLSTQLASLAQASAFRTVSYAMSKAAQNMATRCLAAELTPQGIGVVAVHPGWVRTDMGGAQAPLAPADAAAALLHFVDALQPAQHGGFYACDGAALPW